MRVLRGGENREGKESMSNHQIMKALLAGIVLAAAYIGLSFGADIARFRHMSRALESLESCRTDAECAAAWSEIQAAKGGR